MDEFFKEIVGKGARVLSVSQAYHHDYSVELEAFFDVSDSFLASREFLTPKEKLERLRGAKIFAVRLPDGRVRISVTIPRVLRGRQTQDDRDADFAWDFLKRIIDSSRPIGYQ